MRRPRWARQLPKPAAAKPIRSSYERIAGELHKCGPFCATWFLAELRSLAPQSPHECTHARRMGSRCARRKWPLA